jgi:hypothetical protein
MSDNCRRPKRVKKAFLNWLESKPQYKKRHPTVAEVIREARLKGSPISCIFEQTTRKAAEHYWRDQSQYMLRHVDIVQVVVKTGEVVSKPVRAWIPISIGNCGRIDEDAYVPAQRVANSPSMRQDVIERAHNDFMAWLDRYERYDEFLKTFSPVVEAYRKLRDKIDKQAG